jgi:hypothetical protein
MICSTHSIMSTIPSAPHDYVESFFLSGSDGPHDASTGRWAS